MVELNETYKSLHENFVTGHNGTTLAEISLQLAVSVAGVLLRDSILLFLVVNNQRLHFGSRLLLDFVCAVIPLLLVATLLSNFIFTFFTSLLCFAFGTLVLSCLTKNISSNQKLTWKYILNVDMSGKRPCIDYFRAFVNIGTAVVILAVDFTIFPRRFAKAETYGSGFMDVGVGCFVMANAVVSIEARGKQQKSSSFTGRCMLILKTVKSCIPLVVLGLIRVLAVKSTDYHEHVSEYGVHWNFFLTLALVKILSTVVLTVFPVEISGLLSISIAVIYQYFLSEKGLSDYIRNGTDGTGTRLDLIDANREGIYASIGYVAIYLAGVQLGQFIFLKREKLSDWLNVVLYVFIVCIISGSLLFTCNYFVEPISRRMCNAAYIFWMIALNHMLLAGYLIGDMIITTISQFLQGPQQISKANKMESLHLCLLSAVNYNALSYFLLSNVLTGLVNIGIKTIHTPPYISFIILFSYLFLLSFLTMFLYKFKLSIKFW